MMSPANQRSQRTQRPGNNGNALPVAPQGNQYAAKHGLSSLKKAFSRLGNRTIDGRSRAAVALRKWRQEIVEDLGGKDNISAQQDTILDLACRTRLLLHSVDAWLFEQETVIYSRKKAVYPVVIQRQQLADALARYMTMLGLHRRVKTTTINELLSQRSDDTPSANGNGAEKDAP